MLKYLTEVRLFELKGYPVKAIGDPRNLGGNLVDIFCSQKCPGELILKAYDIAKQIREDPSIVVSGFHSPIEKDIFEILLRGVQPIVLCLARRIEGYHIPPALRTLVESGRLTILAPDFRENQNRITHITAKQRNNIIFQICNQVLIIHAKIGGNLDRTCLEHCSSEKKIFALASIKNEHLFRQGVHTWEIHEPEREDR